jgi:hypothetical protein
MESPAGEKFDEELFESLLADDTEARIEEEH